MKSHTFYGIQNEHLYNYIVHALDSGEDVLKAAEDAYWHFFKRYPSTQEIRTIRTLKTDMQGGE